MNIHEAIYGRRSVRAYDSKAVSERVLKKLVDAAIQAPSAMNEQAWIFTIIRDPDVLHQISTCAKAHILAKATDEVSGQIRAMLADPLFNIFYHAPALVIISGPENSAWMKENCALAAENFMLAAYAEGLGTCWIGFAQHWLATPVGRAAARIPDKHLAVAPIVVGHPKAEASKVPRRSAKIDWIDASAYAP